MNTLLLFGAAYLLLGSSSSSKPPVVPGATVYPTGPAVDNTRRDVQTGIDVVGGIIKGIGDILNRKDGSVTTSV